MSISYYGSGTEYVTMVVESLLLLLESLDLCAAHAGCSQPHGTNCADQARRPCGAWHCRCQHNLRKVRRAAKHSAGGHIHLSSEHWHFKCAFGVPLLSQGPAVSCMVGPALAHESLALINHNDDGY
jgi:hypothetical protein